MSSAPPPIDTKLLEYVILVAAWNMSLQLKGITMLPSLPPFQEAGEVLVERRHLEKRGKGWAITGSGAANLLRRRRSIGEKS
jgi:hypothetical protein